MKIAFPGGSTGGGGGGDGSGLAPESGLLYLLKDGTRAIEGVLIPDGSGTRNLGSVSAPFNAFYAMSGFFGSGTTTIDNSGVNASSITAADEIYLSGVKLSKHISDISQESAVGLAVNGSNRMTGNLNGPLDSPFIIKSFANAGGFDMSDAFDNSSFDTTRWASYVSASCSVTETSKLRMIAAVGNSRNAHIRSVGGAYDMNSDIDVQVHIDPVSTNGSSSTMAVLGLIGNATSNTAAHYEHGQHVDFNPSTQSIQGKAGNYNVGIRGSTGSTTAVLVGFGNTSSAFIYTLNGSTADLAASGGVDLKITYNNSAGSGQLLIRTTGVTSNGGGDWIEMSGGSFSFPTNPQIRMGTYRGTHNATGDYVSFAQNIGTWILDAGGTDTNFTFENSAPLLAGFNIAEFKNNGSGVARIDADGNIYASGSVYGTSQVYVSGIAVGDFLSTGGGSVDLTNVSTNITPDTSGLHSVGTASKPFASGIYDDGFWIRGQDDGQSPGFDRNGWNIRTIAMNGSLTNLESNSILPQSGGSLLWGGRASMKSYTDGLVRVEFNDESEFGFFEASGVRLKAPNGSGWLLSLDNDGILQTSGPFDFNGAV